MPNKIDQTLFSNMHELDSIVTHAKEHSIVPSLWGKGIYNGKIGWGRVLHVIYYIADCIFRIKDKKIKNAFQYTYENYNQTVKLIEEEVATYEQQLVYLLTKSKNFDEKLYKKSRYSITIWNDNLRPLNRSIEKINNLFQKILGEEYSLTKCSFKEIQNFIDIHRLEMAEPPLNLLKKLSLNEELNELEDVQLNKWIEAIVKSSTSIEVNKVHKALITFVSLIKEKICTQYMDDPDLERLEIELAHRGLAIFDKPDPRHIKWRSSLKEGEILSLDNESITLSKVISQEPSDQLNAFSIQEEENLVFLTCKNRALLSLRKKIAESDPIDDPLMELYAPCIIEHAKWVTISPDGKFALVEKIIPATAMYQEAIKNNKPQLLHFLDNKIIHLLQTFCKTNIFPNSLQLKYLGFNASDELKSTKILSKERLDLLKLFHFIEECASGDRKRFIKFYEESGVQVICIPSFFKEVAKNSLSIDFERFNEKPQETAKYNRFKITDHFIIDTAVYLRENLQKSYNTCLTKLISKYKTNKDQVDEYVRERLLHHYTEDKTTCFIRDSRTKEVVREVVNKFNLQKK